MSGMTREFHVLTPVAESNIIAAQAASDGNNPEDCPLKLKVRQIVSYGKLGEELELQCSVRLYSPMQRDFIYVTGNLLPSHEKFAAIIMRKRYHDGFGHVTTPPEARPRF